MICESPHVGYSCDLSIRNPVHCYERLPVHRTRLRHHRTTESPHPVPNKFQSLSRSQCQMQAVVWHVHAKLLSYAVPLPPGNHQYSSTRDRASPTSVAPTAVRSRHLHLSLCASRMACTHEVAMLRHGTSSLVFFTTCYLRP